MMVAVHPPTDATPVFVDFFISYTGRDAAWTRWVASQLEKAGFTTLFQEGDWGGGANFVAEIHRALERCDRLLVLASDAYFKSRWTEEEWTAALYQGRERVIPLRVEDCRLPALLAPLVRADLFSVSEAEAVDRLLASVSPPSGRLSPAQFPGPDPGIPAFPVASWAQSHAPARDPEFQGRENELADLHALLKENPTAVIAGPAGIGKTGLATEYFYCHAGESTFAWWIAGRSAELATHDLAAAAVALRLPEAAHQDERVAAAATINWLQQNSGWLLVVDDVHDQSFVRHLLALRGGDVIVTTTDLGWHGADPIIDLLPWQRNNSIAYLAARLPDGDHDRLASELGDLPLALTQARSYIASTGITVGRYLELLRRRHSSLLARGFTGGHGTTLAAAVELGVAELSADALALLQLFSLLSFEPIPTDLFAAAADLSDVLPGDIADDVVREDALGELRSLGLVRRDGPFVSMHQLVQRLVRETVPVDQQPLLIARAGALLASAVPVWTARPDNWDRCAQLLPHVLTLSEQLEASAMPEPSSWLLNRMGVYVEARGEAALGVELLERAVRLAEAGQDKVAIGSALNNLANAVAAMGDLPRAVELAERSLAEKRAGDAKPMLIARSLGALGSFIRRSGDLDRGLELHREALRLLEGDSETGAHEIAEEKNDIAYCLGELGHYDEAREMHLDALDQFENLQGSDGFDVGHTHAALGALLNEMGLYDDALRHQQLAVAIFEAHLDRGHPDLSPLLSQLGMILMHLGRLDEARATLERAVATMEESYGPDHYALGFRLGNLGLALTEAGDLDAAIRAHQRSLDLLRSGLGEHRSVAIQLNNLGHALHLAGHKAAARDHLEEAFAFVLEMPVEPLLGGVVHTYAEVLLSMNDSAAAGFLLDRLMQRAEEAPEPVRSYLYAWTAGICAYLADTKRMTTCVSRQDGDHPVVLVGRLEHSHSVGLAGDPPSSHP